MADISARAKNMWMRIWQITISLQKHFHRVRCFFAVKDVNWLDMLDSGSGNHTQFLSENEQQEKYQKRKKHKVSTEGM